MKSWHCLVIDNDFKYIIKWGLSKNVISYFGFQLFKLFVNFKFISDK